MALVALFSPVPRKFPRRGMRLSLVRQRRHLYRAKSYSIATSSLRPVELYVGFSEYIHDRSAFEKTSANDAQACSNMSSACVYLWQYKAPDAVSNSFGDD